MPGQYARPIVESPDYEYYGLMAEAWDLLRGDTSGWEDRPFYLGIIRRAGEPALDVGCGTGRLLLDYLNDGVDIDGVDVSAEMLALCRAKAKERGLTPALYEQSIEELKLPRRYRTVIVPSSSFQLVLDPSAARRALARLAEHLEPGGALVMPFMILEGEHRWVKEASERHLQSPATRSYTLDQARELYEAAGLEIERIVAGFTDEPYDGGEIFTIVAHRPA